MSALKPMPRHPRFLDLTGRRFGRWVVIGYVGRIEPAKRGSWLCRCDCGAEKALVSRHLIVGDSKSCGCLQRDLAGTHSITHGHTRENRRPPEYLIWQGMIQRCTNRRHITFGRYGGRGIKVCARWMGSFEAFFEDMGPKPSPSHSLDRYPDRDGNYEPGNVRWATSKEQTRNTRRNHWITYRGETLSMIEWAERLGMSYHLIRNRLKCGWGVEETMETPPHGKRKPPV
jgi:hypothetical protein